MELNFHTPLDRPPWTDWLYLHPLYFAVWKHRRSYALWMMRHGASISTEQVIPGRSILSSFLRIKSLDLDRIQFLFPRDEGRRTHLSRELCANGGYQVFKMVHDTNHTDEILALPIQLRDGWLDDRKRWTRFLVQEEPNLQNPPVLASEAEKCWDYLFDVFPAVPNCLVERPAIELSIPYVHISFDSTLQPSLDVRYFGPLSIQYPFARNTKTILTQTLEMGQNSLGFFRISVSRFIRRAEMRGQSEPFPAQTWRDWRHVSPLDKLLTRDRSRAWLRTSYGYGISLHCYLSYNLFLTFLALIITYAVLVVALAFLGSFYERMSSNRQNVMPEGLEVYRAYFLLLNFGYENPLGKEPGPLNRFLTKAVTFIASTFVSIYTAGATFVGGVFLCYFLSRACNSFIPLATYVALSLPGLIMGVILLGNWWWRS
jgi:hypothetical protein